MEAPTEIKYNLYQKESKSASYRDTFTVVFQWPGCPSIHKSIKTGWHTDTGPKNEIMALSGTWMELKVTV